MHGTSSVHTGARVPKLGVEHNNAGPPPPPPDPTPTLRSSYLRWVIGAYSGEPKLPLHPPPGDSWCEPGQLGLTSPMIGPGEVTPF